MNSNKIAKAVVKKYVAGNEGKNSSINNVASIRN